jgi:hypothetical protein
VPGPGDSELGLRKHRYREDWPAVMATDYKSQHTHGISWDHKFLEGTLPLQDRSGLQDLDMISRAPPCPGEKHPITTGFLKCSGTDKQMWIHFHSALVTQSN